MNGLLFNMGHIILQERHLLCYTWPTHAHTNKPQRHRRLGRSLGWLCSPWHSSPSTLGNLASTRHYLIHAGGGSEGVSWGRQNLALTVRVTLWEVQATPHKGVTPFQAPQGNEAVHRPDLLGWTGATPAPPCRADFPWDWMSLQPPHENRCNLNADLPQKVFMRLV